MAYVVPSFNLQALIFDNDGAGNYTNRIVGQPCCLSTGRRVNVATNVSGVKGGPLQAFPITTEIMFPALTDLHTAFNGFFPDVIECPMGTGRYYMLADFEDVAKGRNNEYRLAWCFKVYSGSGALISYAIDIPDWPAPTP